MKVKLSGTAREIKWFRKILIRDKRMDLMRMSEMLTDEKNPKYHRLYVDLRKNLSRQKK